MLLSPDDITRMCAMFDDAWSAGDELAQSTRCWILAIEPFRLVLTAPRLKAVLHTLFSGQAQLLDFYPIYQPPAVEEENGHCPRRDWHRDFSFVRDKDGFPLMVTVLVFLDDVRAEVGPTLALPGSHRMARRVIAPHDPSPHPGEVALPVRPGEGLLLNSAIIHSPGQNTSAAPRRGLVMNFGYWWMKPWDMDRPLPAGIRQGLTAELECLLGLKSPAADLYHLDSSLFQARYRAA